MKKGCTIKMPIRLLAIIPAYNEEACINNTVEELRTVVPGIDHVVIDDGSKDATACLCREHGFNLISLPVNSGLTVGFQAGMRYALQHGYDYAIQFDADGQHRPEFIKPLLECAEREHADIVIGSRFVLNKKEHSARMIGSRLITSIIRLTTRKTIADPTSGFRLFNRKMIVEYAKNEMINPEPETLAYFLRKGACIKEVQVDMRERQAGESYFNISQSVIYMIRVCISILFVQWFRG